MEVHASDIERPTRSPAAGAAPSLHRATPRQAQLLGLQRSAGNMAVSRLLGHAAVQRCGPIPCDCEGSPVQREDAPAAGAPAQLPPAPAPQPAPPSRPSAPADSPLPVQRDFFEDAVAGASDLATAASQTASGAASAVAEAASSAASAVGDAASAVGDAASSAASTAVDAASGAVRSAAGAVSAGVTAVTDTASDVAAASKPSPALASAIAQGSALAGRFGGRVSLVGTKLVIALPRYPIMGARTTPLGELPSATLRLPILGAGTVAGPVLLKGDLAVEVAIRPEMIGVVGPADVRDVRIELDPLAGNYSATGTLHVSGSESLITPVEAGLDARLAAVIMAGEVPIPVEADAFGGLRLALRGSGLGSVDERVTLAYSSGALSLDSLSTLKLGARLDAELDATVELNVYDESVCVYTWPLASWLLAENAEQYELPS